MPRVSPLGQAPLLVLAAFMIVAGCARSVDLSAEPGQSYAVEVVNPMPHPMIVSFDDGAGEQTLGTVPANGRERWVVAGASGRTVSIIAHDERESHTVRRTVTLVPGETVEVRLTQS